MPVAHLGVPRSESLGRAVLPTGRLPVPLLDGKIPGVHVFVCTVELEQSLEFLHRLGMILHPEIDQPVFPNPAGGLRGHHQERGGLLSPDVPFLPLRRLQGGVLVTFTEPNSLATRRGMDFVTLTDHDTIAGYIAGEIGRIPDVGETIRVDGIEVTVQGDPDDPEFLVRVLTDQHEGGES